MLTRNKVLSHAILILLIVSAIPTGFQLASRNASAANPVLSNYGVVPLYGDSGASFLFWCTYTDADNDTPTYVRIVRYASYTTDYKDMIANDTGDTTYTDGKQYYYTWSYFPFIGTITMRFLTVSNSSPIVSKVQMTTQTVQAMMINNGVTPSDYTPGNHTFFTTYQSTWGYAPTYVKINLDGTLFDMIKNDSGTNWPSGEEYYYTSNLSAGMHYYSFHATESLGFCPDRTSGVFWIVIEDAASPEAHISFGIIALIALIGACMIMVWRSS
jgi:hypothetical protein